MIEDEKKRGKWQRECVIIQPTSGNTGIGLFSVCATKGYKCVLVIPENMSSERIKLIEAYGADIVLSPAKLGMKDSIEKVEELAKSYENSFIPSQFENPSNLAL